MHLPLNATDNDILDFVKKWVYLLKDGDFAAAYQHTLHDKYYAWTPELIETVIKNYGSVESFADGRKYYVTDPKTAKGDSPSQEVQRDSYDDERIGYVWYDLPLNGEWSDLTATFRLIIRDDRMAFILEEIHVF